MTKPEDSMEQVAEAQRAMTQFLETTSYDRKVTEAEYMSRELQRDDDD